VSDDVPSTLPLLNRFLQNYVNASTTVMTRTIQTLKEAPRSPDMEVRLADLAVVEIIHSRSFSSKLDSAVSLLVEEAIDS